MNITHKHAGVEEHRNAAGEVTSRQFITDWVATTEGRERRDDDTEGRASLPHDGRS